VERRAGTARATLMVAELRRPRECAVPEERGKALLVVSKPDPKGVQRGQSSDLGTKDFGDRRLASRAANFAPPLKRARIAMRARHLVGLAIDASTKHSTRLLTATAHLNTDARWAGR
jgi:hypothetical protein